MSDEYSAYELCKTTGVNRSSYSYWLKKGHKTEDKKVEFFQKIIEIYASSGGIYGAPKITAILRTQGVNRSVSTVSRAMNTLGIRSIVAEKFRKKKNAMSDEEKQHIVNLIKDLSVNRINQVWTTDISYIKTTDEGNFYLISFLDYFSKAVVAWDLTTRQRAADIIDVLKSGLSKRSVEPGLIIHSDKGSQMRSSEYRKFLSKRNFIPSYTSLNHSCDENAAQESFHALLKKECIYQNKPKNFNEAYSLIFNYIENFYNSVRIHSSIGYLPPLTFEKSSSSPSLCV